MDSNSENIAPGLGFIPDPHDQRDVTWRAAVAPQAISTPNSFKISSVGGVLNQGATSQCTCYATATLKMHQEFKEHKKYYKFDPAWLYAIAKSKDGIPDQDGTYLRIVLAEIQNTGYLAKAERYKLKDDTHFKIEKYVRLTSIQQVKEALYHVGPVVFGIMLDDGIYTPDKTGVIPEPNDRTIGGHAMAMVGWNDNKKCQGSKGAFLVKNSWGAEYGNKGYIWYPYSHFTHYDEWDAWRTVDASELVVEC